MTWLLCEALQLLGRHAPLQGRPDVCSAVRLQLLGCWSCAACNSCPVALFLLPAQGDGRAGGAGAHSGRAARAGASPARLVGRAWWALPAWLPDLASPADSGGLLPRRQRCVPVEPGCFAPGTVLRPSRERLSAGRRMRRAARSCCARRGGKRERAPCRQRRSRARNPAGARHPVGAAVLGRRTGAGSARRSRTLLPGAW